MSHIHPADFWQIVEQLKQTEEKLRRAEARLKLAEEVLEFYANSFKQSESDIDCQEHDHTVSHTGFSCAEIDEGDKARKALAKIRGEKCTVEE